MQNETLRRFAIYSRKSRFTGKGESIENQIELCRQYITQIFCAEAADRALIFEDEGYSGGNLDRPRFKQMMQAAERGEIDAIVVYRLDRISRSIGDFAALIDRLSQLEIAFLSIREQFDTSSPMGRAMMYIASVFSQLERETIAERIRDNLHELAKGGRWLGGVAPTGFTAEAVTTVALDGKRHRASRLCENAEEMAAVRRIFTIFLTDGSLSETVTRMAAEGYRARGGGSFSRYAIRAILENPVYMCADDAAFRYLTEHGCELTAARDAFDGTHGVMPYNRTLQRRGKTHIHRPMDEWIVAVGTHPGVIRGETWILAQQLLARNKRGARTPRTHTAILSGVLFCACGAPMRVKLSERLDDSGERRFRYICTAREKSRGTSCHRPGADGRALDAAVLATLLLLPEDSAEWERQKMQLEREYQPHGREQDATRLRSMEREIQVLVRSLTQAEGSVSAPYIIRQIEKLHVECDRLRQRMENPEKETVLDASLARLSTMGNVLSIVERRSVVRALVSKMIWDGTDVHVYLRGK